MTIIDLYTSGQALLSNGNKVVASGDVNSLKVRVEFDSEWDGFAKSVIFYVEGNDEDTYEAVLFNNECEVPAEVLVEKGNLIIGIRGVKEDGSVKTSTLIRQKIRQGTPTGVVTDPTPSVYQQIISSFSEINDSLNQVSTDLETEKTQRIKGDDDLETVIIKSVNQAIEACHPIGSLYMSTRNIDPSRLFDRTTWERIKDTFILACGDEFEAGAVGGEKEHTLTINEIPSHYHEVKQNINDVPTRVVSLYNTNHNTTTTNEFAVKESAIELIEGGTDALTTANVGGGQAHNNMPPYMAVYVWKRIS